MIRPTFTSCASFLVACTFLAVGQSHANLISNGSFESPAEATGLSSVRPAGWTGFAGFGNGLVNGPALAAGGPTIYPAALDGSQYVDIGAGELVTQFTVADPGDYRLSWFDNSLITGANGSYSLEIKDASSAKIVSTAYSYSYLTPSPPWRELSLDISNLAIGTYTLAFGPGTSFTFLDNVSLDSKTVSTAAPDSGSTGILLLSACLGMSTLVRTGKRK
jgi:hypothetical protein